MNQELGRFPWATVTKTIRGPVDFPVICDECNEVINTEDWCREIIYAERDKCKLCSIELSQVNMGHDFGRVGHHFCCEKCDQETKSKAERN